MVSWLGCRTCNLPLQVRLVAVTLWDWWPSLSSQLSYHHLGRLSLASLWVAKLSTSFGWGKGGKVAAAGWQVILYGMLFPLAVWWSLIMNWCTGLLHFADIYAIKWSLLFIQSSAVQRSLSVDSLWLRKVAVCCVVEVPTSRLDVSLWKMLSVVCHYWRLVDRQTSWSVSDDKW